MTSSTSHSDQPSRFFWLKLLVVAVLAWGLAVFYSLHIDPEVRFWKEAGEAKVAWAASLEAEHGYKVIVAGGSSCAFGIDAERLYDKFQLPIANMGLHAGMGKWALTEFALSQVQPGDTFIVSLEPNLFYDARDTPSLGVKLKRALAGQVSFPSLQHNKVDPFKAVSDALNLRPGGSHLFTMLAKIVASRPLYRYQAADMRRGGGLVTPIRYSFPTLPPAVLPATFPEDTVRFLERLRAYCEARGITVAYALPWAYVASPFEEEARLNKVRFIKAVSQYLPVLKDAKLGVYTVARHFADTEDHLTEEGAILRSDALAAQIRGWRVWTERDLERHEGELKGLLLAAEVIR